MGLADLTKNYWTISSVYNGRIRPDRPITTEQALKGFREILNNTNPARPLARATSRLADEIVRGPESRKVKLNTNP